VGLLLLLLLQISRPTPLLLLLSLLQNEHRQEDSSQCHSLGFSCVSPLDRSATKFASMLLGWREMARSALSSANGRSYSASWQ
jgi:hypothetical protein